MSTPQFLVLGLIVTSLPALYVSVQRVVKEKSVLTAGLVLLAGAFTATFISAMFHIDCFGKMVPDVSLELGMDLDLVFLFKGLFASGLAMNVMNFLLVRYVTEKHLWKFAAAYVGLFFLGCLAVGYVVSEKTDMSLDNSFFAVCCGSMGVTGMAWGLNYKEICMIINIYLQAGICLATALWVVWRALQRLMRKPTFGSWVIMILAGLYGLVNIVAFIWLCQHYAMPMEKAFDLCYYELIYLAGKYNTTYNNVNYYIFIILFVGLTVGNMLISRLIKLKDDKSRTEER